VLQCVAVCCSVLQCAAMCCIFTHTPYGASETSSFLLFAFCFLLFAFCTYKNRALLQKHVVPRGHVLHTATHCNTLQHTVPRGPLSGGPNQTKTFVTTFGRTPTASLTHPFHLLTHLPTKPAIHSLTRILIRAPTKARTHMQSHTPTHARTHPRTLACTT